MPIELRLSGSIGSISYKGQNVNIFGEDFSKVFVESDTLSPKYSIAPDESESPRDYDKPITISDVLRLREIIKAHGGERVSINDFTSEDIQKAQKWAYKFYKDLGTKSPFFRAWFGDWRAYDGNTQIKYVPVNTEEISVQDVSKAGAINNDTGWEIAVNRNGIDETANKNNKWSAAYHSLKNINDMLESAVLVDTVVVDAPSSRMDKTATFIHHMYCPVTVNGEKGIAKLYITENIGDEHKFYLTKIEMESVDSMGQGKSGDPNSSIDSVISIADIYDFVKANNEKFEKNSEKPTKFEPRPVNEHILDENKEPRIFHHGTALENGDFTVFDESKAKKKLGLGIKALGKGNYFTSVDLKNNGRYGKGRIIDAYLRLNQPLILDREPYKNAVNRIINDDMSKYSPDDIQIMLREKGYDGVIVVEPDGNCIVNVFDSENIKSATDNIGTFDRGNKDITYSIAPLSPREMLHNEIAGLSDEEIKKRGLLTYRRNIDKYNDLRQQREEILDSIGTLSIDGKGRATTILDRVADAGKRVSINDFTSEDIQKAQKWAYKFYKELESYHKGYGVKSPFFRAWFGDWRMYEQSPILKTPNVRLIHSFKSTKEASDYFKRGIKERTLFRGDTKNRDTNFTINIGAQVYNDTLSYASRELSRNIKKSSTEALDKYNDRLSILEEIKEICESSILLDTVVSKSDDFNDQSFVHIFYTTVELEGRKYFVRLTVDELNSLHGDIRRAYNLNAIEITPVAVSQVYKPAGTTDVTGHNVSSNSISQLYSLVKTYDKDFHAGKLRGFSTKTKRRGH